MNAQEALATTYGQGIADGFEIALRLLLGETTEGTVGFTGPLTPETEAWALLALKRLTDAKDAA